MRKINLDDQATITHKSGNRRMSYGFEHRTRVSEGRYAGKDFLVEIDVSARLFVGGWLLNWSQTTGFCDPSTRQYLSYEAAGYRFGEGTDCHVVDSQLKTKLSGLVRDAAPVIKGTTYEIAQDLEGFGGQA